MKNRRVKLLLICGLLSLSLCACNKKGEEVPEEQVQQEQVQSVNLSGVNAGQVLSMENLIDYANTLAGVTDVNAVSCFTETESNVTQVTLQEGVHTITIAYNTVSGTSGEVQLVYEAGPGEVVEEQPTDEEPVETEDDIIEEVSIPVENRIKLTVTDGTTSMSEEEFTADESLTAGSMVNVTGADATLSMYEPLTSMIERKVSNKYAVNGTEYDYQYDDANYVAVIDYNVYNQDGTVFFEVSSVNSNDKLYYGLILSEEAKENDELFNDEVNAAFDTIEDYYTFEFTYEPKIVDTSEENESEEPEEESTETSSKDALIEEKLSALVGKSYQEEHPELYIWPENPIKYSRWDYRITDSTTFNSNITLSDGTVIPEAQRNSGDEGYSYDMGGSTFTESGNKNNATQAGQIVEQRDEAVIFAGLKRFRINEHRGYGITVDVEESTEKSVKLEQNGSIFYVKVIPTADWTKYSTTDYYGNNPTNMEVVLGETIEIGAGDLKTTVQCRTIQFTDSTGSTVERSYMYGINCNDSYLIIVGDSQPTRGNDTLYKIVSNCIEPIEAE